MKNILSIIQESTSCKCYKSTRYCSDEELRLHTLDYDDNQKYTLCRNRFGETDRTLKKTKCLKEFSLRICDNTPLFRYFLDGSRRVYKIDDMEINKRIFPIMAGQIGVACCERVSKSKLRCREFENSLIIALPSEANPEIRNFELFLNRIKDDINRIEKVRRTGIQFSKIKLYSSKSVTDSDILKGGNDKYESEGTALIQDEMIDNEKKVVASLTTKNLLNECSYLIKDGSLQYKPMKTGEYKELSKIKNNYRWVIGVSKIFNPELTKDYSGKSNAAALANLQLFHRTPAYMFQHDRDKWSYLGDYKYSVWYIRIRAKERTESPFAGIVKIEKILITEDEIENGLESDLVDVISANIINERNPVCYGKDNRWANHLYPIYLTEQFIKSKYLSDIHFLNLF